jgi:hypothetical protein
MNLGEEEEEREQYVIQLWKAGRRVRILYRQPNANWYSLDVSYESLGLA